MSGLPLILVCISLLQIFFDIHRATVPWSTHVMNECFSHTDTVLLVIRWNRHFVVLIMAYFVLVRTYCSGTCYLAYTSLCDSRRVARILHWGTTEAARVHFFSQKVDDLFCRRPQNLSSPSSGVHILDIFWGPQNTALLTSDRENSVTLLNKAGPTSQQSQFFSVKKIHSIDDWGWPPWLRPCVTEWQNETLTAVMR